MTTVGKSTAAMYRTMATSWKRSATATACAATPLRAIITAVQRQNRARDKPLVGRVTYVNGDAQEFTDADEFLRCVQEELPYRPTTGLRYEVLTDDPNLRKQVDDMIFDFYGEENPRQLEGYQKTSKQGMTMGGM